MAEVIEQIEEPPCELLTLDVNCLEKIFEFLPENDLSALSRTCKRLKQETERFFSINHKSGIVRIKDPAGIVQFDFKKAEKFEIRFRSQIRNLCVEMYDQASVLNTFQFINENCAPSLLKLKVDNFTFPHRADVPDGSLHIDRDHCNPIAAQLQHLEVLHVHDSPGAGIMEYCENLRVLFATNGRYSDNSWMHGICPTLEMLFLNLNRGDFDITAAGTTNFIRNHKQLKSIVCFGEIAALGLCAIEHPVPYAAMLLFGMSDIRDIWNEFEECCKRRNIEWLDVLSTFNGSYVDSDAIKGILRLAQVKGLHYNVEEMNFVFTGIYPIIERMCLNFRVYFGETLMDEVEKIGASFPNLQRLRLKFWGLPFDDIQSILLRIVSKLPLLEHLYFDCPIDSRKVADDFYLDPDFIGVDFANLNAGRAKLSNAIPVIVHFNEFFEGKYKIVASEPNMIIAKFDYESCKCPICEISYNEKNYLQKFQEYLLPLIN